MAVAWVLSPKRFELVKFSSILTIDNLVTILSAEEKVDPLLGLLTTFEPITWWLLIISLLLYSLINSKRIKVYDLLISLIDHIECLLTKQSKLFAYFNNLNNLNFSWFTSIK